MFEEHLEQGNSCNNCGDHIKANYVDVYINKHENRFYIHDFLENRLLNSDGIIFLCSGCMTYRADGNYYPEIKIPNYIPKEQFERYV